MLGPWQCSYIGNVVRYTSRSCSQVYSFRQFPSGGALFKLQVPASCLGISVVDLASLFLSSLVLCSLIYPSHFLLTSFLWHKLTSSSFPPVFSFFSPDGQVQLGCRSVIFLFGVCNLIQRLGPSNFSILARVSPMAISQHKPPHPSTWMSATTWPTSI